MSAATVLRVVGNKALRPRSHQVQGAAHSLRARWRPTPGRPSRRRMRTRGARAGGGAGAAQTPPASEALARTAAPTVSRARERATTPRCWRSRRALASWGPRAPAGGSRAQTPRLGPSSSAPPRPPVLPPAGPMCAASHPARLTAPGTCSGAQPELSLGLWEGHGSLGCTGGLGKGSRQPGMRPVQRSSARAGRSSGQPRALVPWAVHREDRERGLKGYNGIAHLCGP